MRTTAHSHRFLPAAINGDVLEHHCVFRGNGLVEYWKKSVI